MGIYLNVPYSNQLLPAVGGLNVRDATGCWLHSATMVRSYFGETQPVIMPELYFPGLPTAARSAIQAALPPEAVLPNGHFATGSPGARAAMREAMRSWLQRAIGNPVSGPIPPSLQMNEHQLLADRAGMEPLRQCGTPHFFNAHELVQLLRSNGPIIFYWQKTSHGHTYGHASVMIGVTNDNQQIWYHDPENAPNSRMPIHRFNSVRQVWQFAMMRRRNVAIGAIHPAAPPGI